MLQLPILSDQVDSIELLVDIKGETLLQMELHQGPENGSTFPERQIWSGSVELGAGEKQWVRVPLGCKIDQPGWHFLIIAANDKVDLHMGKPTTGSMRYGIRRVNPHKPNPFSKWGRQRDAVYCYRIQPQQRAYESSNVISPWSRPTNLPNLWASKRTEFQEAEWLELSWKQPQKIQEITVLFDSMLDFQFRQRLIDYGQNVISSLVKKYRLLARKGSQPWETLVQVDDNYQRLCRHSFDPIEISEIKLEILETNGLDRAQVYALRVY